MSTLLALEKEVSPMTRLDRRDPGAQPASSRIPVVEGQKLRTGVPVVAGYITANQLIPDNYAIPTYDPRTDKGYQRPLQDSRVNELVSDLKMERVDLPTAILLNLRHREARHAIKDGHLDLDLLRETLLSSAVIFYVVDGQHRVAAFRKLMEEDAARWGAFRIPFVCMVGATEQEEMEQFYVVNSRAKSVRTDLAFALLRKITDRDSKMMQRLDEKGKGWQVAAEKLVEALAETSSVWRGLIRLAAMEKGSTTMPSASMVTSLKPLLSSPFFSRLTPEAQQQVIEAYWAGLRDAMRPAFDDPAKFVVQKGVGVIVLHAILVEAIEIARSKGKSVIEAATYREIMQTALQELQGEAQDGVGSPVRGVDFWRTAPDGAAGSYSSSAGRRLLITKIRQLLPKVEVV